MKITVVGLGYVGLSVAALLASRNPVTGLDISPQRVAMIQAGKTPFCDPELEKALAEGKLDLTVTTDPEAAMADAKFVVIATPTSYCDSTGAFDMTAVESTVDQALRYAPGAALVIKSTVPVGYTQGLCGRTGETPVLFSPEFLREGYALQDNRYPSRIIVGVDKNDRIAVEKARIFAQLMADCAQKKDVPVRLMGTREAEAVKLFSNAYLALRIGFFNELDTFGQSADLQVQQVIEGVCLDPRIGNYYNNPSFGYGGYCLPKDTKQLLGEFAQVPQKLVEASVQANDTRVRFIAEQICKLLEQRKGNGTPTLGVYLLAMKSNSDNCRESAVLKVLEKMRGYPCRILIYEPSLQDVQMVAEYEVCRDLALFKEKSDLIIANRWDEKLADVAQKVYTRDLFHYN